MDTVDILNDVTGHIREEYGAEPEYMWARFPNYAVFRHKDNRKWFALVMDVSAEKLGLPEGRGKVWVLNLKLDDPLLTDMLIQQNKSCRPAYHSSRKNWISVLLDGSASLEDIIPLIRRSFEVTAQKSGRAGRT